MEVVSEVQWVDSDRDTPTPPPVDDVEYPNIVHSDLPPGLAEVEFSDEDDEEDVEEERAHAEIQQHDDEDVEEERIQAEIERARLRRDPIIPNHPVDDRQLTSLMNPRHRLL